MRRAKSSHRIRRVRAHARQTVIESCKPTFASVGTGKKEEGMDRLGSVCRRLARWVLPLTLLCGGLASLALAQPSYEAHPVLRASDLASPNVGLG